MNGVLAISVESFTGLLFRSLGAGSIILGIALVLAPLVWRRAPAGRHVTYGLALLAFVFLQVVAPIGPKIVVPVPVHHVFADPTPTQGQVATPNGSATSEAGRVIASATEAIGLAAGFRSGALQNEDSTSSPRSVWFVFLWLLPAIGLLGTLGTGVRSAVRVIQEAHPVTDEVLRHVSHAPAATILESERIAYAFTWGFLRHSIVLPMQWREWEPKALDAIVAHESAHVRRRDSLINLASGVVCAVFWFHPFVWWVTRRMRHEAERVCDLEAVGDGLTALEYAEVLVALALPKAAVLHTRLSPVASLGASSLERRVRSLLSGLGSAAPIHPLKVGMCAAALGALSLLVSGVEPTRASPLEAPGVGPPPVVAPDDALPAPASNTRSEEVRGAVRPSQEPMAEPDSLPWFISALRSPNPETRLLTAESLGDKRVVQSIDALMERAAEDSAPRVRSAAIWALGEIRSPQATDVVGRALLDGDPNVRAAAMIALEELTDPRSAPHLFSALERSDVETRRSAAALLGELALDQAPSELIEALTDSDGSVRAEAARALGEIKDPAALGPLVHLIDDPEIEVSVAGLYALKEVGTQQAYLALLRASDSPRDAVGATATALLRTW